MIWLVTFRRSDAGGFELMDDPRVAQRTFSRLLDLSLLLEYKVALRGVFADVRAFHQTRRQGLKRFSTFILHCGEEDEE